MSGEEIIDAMRVAIAEIVAETAYSPPPMSTLFLMARRTMLDVARQTMTKRAYRRWRGRRVAMPPEDIEHNIATTGSSDQGFTTGSFNRAQPIGEHCIEDGDHLAITIIAARERRSEKGWAGRYGFIRLQPCAMSSSFSA